MRRIRFKTLRGFGPGRFSPPLQKPSERIAERAMHAARRALRGPGPWQEFLEANAAVAMQRHTQAVVGAGCPLVIARLAALSSLAALDAKQGARGVIKLAVDTDSLGSEAAMRTGDFPLLVSVGETGDLEIHLPGREPLLMRAHEALLIQEALASLGPRSSTGDGPTSDPSSSTDGSDTRA